MRAAAWPASEIIGETVQVDRPFFAIVLYLPRVTVLL